MTHDPDPMKFWKGLILALALSGLILGGGVMMVMLL
jgi:hypothetical protein